MGFGSACFIIGWAETFTSMRASDHRTASLFIGLILATLFSIVLLLVPPLVTNIALFVLPLAMPLAFLSGSTTAAPMPSDKNKAPLSAQFFFSCLVYTIPLGYFQMRFASSAESNFETWLTGLICAMALLAVAFIGLRYASDDMEPILIPKIVMPLVIVGLFAFPPFNISTAFMAGALVLLGQQLVITMLFSQFASISVDEGRSSVKVFAQGIATSVAGLTVGMIVHQLVISSVAGFHVELALIPACMLAVIAFLIFGNRKPTVKTPTK